MRTSHPLLDAQVVRAIERAASQHLGRRWASYGFTDLSDRASHSCGIHHGGPFSVFAKLGSAADAQRQFAAELSGLKLISERAQVATPTPVASGTAVVPAGSLLLFEALPERAGAARTRADFRAIGQALARLHQIHAPQFGLAMFDGFFGPLPQDNHPLPDGSWADFYAERRVLPMLALAANTGGLPRDLRAGVERLVLRLPSLCGPEPQPSLLHGDAQQNNFLAAPSGAVLIDACPYFGHPEIDLALLDYFEPVSDEVLRAYQEITPIDPGFNDRRELWRIFGYLAVIAVDGRSSLGQRFLARVAAAVGCYT